MSARRPDAPGRGEGRPRPPKTGGHDGGRNAERVQQGGLPRGGALFGPPHRLCYHPGTMNAVPSISRPGRFERRPRSLAALIDIYESNYFRIQRLVPELEHLQGTLVSRVAGALDLYLAILERQKYTTTLVLTYRFPGAEGSYLEPNARITICHDVRTVEVVSHARRKRHRGVRPWRRNSMPELDRKWELNRFLQKWLGFCHRQGHLFLRVTAQPVVLPELERSPADLER